MGIMIDHGQIDIKQRKGVKLNILLQLGTLDHTKNMMPLRKNFIKYTFMIRKIM